jgi:hypothetical protein
MSLDKINWFKMEANMKDSSISCRYGDMGTGYDDYESESTPKKAHHVEGDEWKTGVVSPTPMHSSVRMSWTWPTTVRKVMNKA